jgi:hypothetical protein
MADPDSSSRLDFYEGQSLLEVDLVDDPSKQGETHAPLGEGRYGREVSGFAITLRELHCVHGSGEWPSKKTGQLEKSFATLLVYRIKLTDYNPSRGRRLKNLVVRLRFKSEMPKAKDADEPFIVCYAPAQDHDISLLKTKLLRTKNRTRVISLDVDANPAPVVLRGELGVNDSWEWEKDVWATMSGTALETPPGIHRRGPDMVQWVIGENKFAETIINSCDVAILLRRPNDSPFTVEFSGIKASVDARYTLADALRKTGETWAELVGDESSTRNKYTYNTTDHGNCPEGVNSAALHELEVGNELEKYAFMHISEEMRGVRE